jgi:sugar O-acyltransferase (sialic acid O-acetyltransferase NeuD family)
MSKPTIGIIGAGGQCKVVIDIINEMGTYEIAGIYDDHKTGFVSGVKIIGLLSDIKNARWIDSFIIAIGNDQVRKAIDEADGYNLRWATLIHPRAIVSKSAKIWMGSVVCAGAVIQPEVTIGKHCIINTNCNIDHEAHIGNYCSICPGVTICGQVTIGEKTFVGANATIIQTLSVGNNCVIGAGTVIIRNVDDNQKIVGNPGRLIS